MVGVGFVPSLPRVLLHPLPPRGPTCAKKPRVLRRAWSILLVKRARSWRQVSAQPLTLPQVCPAAPRSRSVSRGSSAAGAEMVFGKGFVPGGVRGHRGIPPAQQGRDAAFGSTPSPPSQPPAPTSPGSFGSM